MHFGQVVAGTKQVNNPTDVRSRIPATRSVGRKPEDLGGTTGPVGFMYRSFIRPMSAGCRALQ